MFRPTASERRVKSDRSDSPASGRPQEVTRKRDALHSVSHRRCIHPSSFPHSFPFHSIPSSLPPLHLSSSPAHSSTFADPLAFPSRSHSLASTVHIGAPLPAFSMCSLAEASSPRGLMLDQDSPHSIPANPSHAPSYVTSHVPAHAHARSKHRRPTTCPLPKQTDIVVVGNVSFSL